MFVHGDLAGRLRRFLVSTGACAVPAGTERRFASSSAGTKKIGRHLWGMQRRLRPSIKIQPPRPRWRVRQAKEEDESDEALLGLGAEKDGSSGK